MTDDPFHTSLPTAEPKGTFPAQQHNVDPATGRCVRCGLYASQHKEQPKCMTTGDYVTKWQLEADERMHPDLANCGCGCDLCIHGKHCNERLCYAASSETRAGEQEGSTMIATLSKMPDSGWKFRCPLNHPSGHYYFANFTAEIYCDACDKLPIAVAAEKPPLPFAPDQSTWDNVPEVAPVQTGEGGTALESFECSCVQGPCPVHDKGSQLLGHTVYDSVKQTVEFRPVEGGSTGPDTPIKPCPFCAGIAYLDEHPRHQSGPDAIAYFYRCNSCGCEGPWVTTRGNALREWNFRAAASVQGGGIAPTLKALANCCRKYLNGSDVLHTQGWDERCGSCSYRLSVMQIGYDAGVAAQVAEIEELSQQRDSLLYAAEHGGKLPINHALDMIKQINELRERSEDLASQLKVAQQELQQHEYGGTMDSHANGAGAEQQTNDSGAAQEDAGSSADFITALGKYAPDIAWSGEAGRYVEAILANIADSVLPDGLNRPLAERVRLLLERADREASLAVRLKTKLEAAETLVGELLAECFVKTRQGQWAFRTHNGVPMGMGAKKEKLVKRAEELTSKQKGKA